MYSLLYYSVYSMKKHEFQRHVNSKWVKLSLYTNSKSKASWKCFLIIMFHKMEYFLSASLHSWYSFCICNIILGDSDAWNMM